jgi:hypothetical protein
MIAIGQSSTDSSITRQPSPVGLLHPPLGLRLAAGRPPVSLRWVALRRPGGCPPAEHRQTTPPRSAQWLSWNSEVPEAPQAKEVGVSPARTAVRPYSGLQPCPEGQVVQHARQHVFYCPALFRSTTLPRETGRPARSSAPKDRDHPTGSVCFLLDHLVLFIYRPDLGRLSAGILQLCGHFFAPQN